MLSRSITVTIATEVLDDILRDYISAEVAEEIKTKFENDFDIKLIEADRDTFLLNKETFSDRYPEVSQ